MVTNYETLARNRVGSTPILQAHYDTIFYDWPNWAEHMEWIAMAPVEEIIDWAESVSEYVNLPDE